MDLSAQMPPAIDPGSWMLDDSRSDEFNGTMLDTVKWWAIDPCNYTDSIHHGYNWSGGCHFRPQNVSVVNGNAIITADYNSDSLNDSIPCYHYPNFYRFYSGGIQSKQVKMLGLGAVGSYSFGYYEMRAKLPGYYDVNSLPVGKGFMPTFWFYYQYWQGSCIKKHDEVDILEPDPSQYYDARTNVVGWHDENNACSVQKIGQASLTSANPLFDDFHKYAVELLPDRIVFYFDDQPFFSADTLASPQYTHSLDFSPYLAVVIDFQIGNNPYPPSDAPFPQFMYIDYFRYYRLKISQSALFQNYPNPVNTYTQITYSIATGSMDAFIKVYEATGHEIRSVQLTEKGRAKITLDCSSLKPGVYVYSLEVDKTLIGARKMIVIK